MQQYNLFVEKRMGSWLFSVGLLRLTRVEAADRSSISRAKTRTSITPLRQRLERYQLLPRWNKLRSK